MPKCFVVRSSLELRLTCSCFLNPVFSYIPEPSPLLHPSGLFWSPVAGQVLHRVAKPILDNDAVHGGFGHPQLQPDGSL